MPSSGQLVKNEIKRSFRKAANLAVNDPAVRSRVVAHLLVAMDKSAATTPAEKPSAVVTAAITRKQHPRKKTARTLSTGRHTLGTSGPSVYRAPHLPVRPTAQPMMRPKAMGSLLQARTGRYADARSILRCQWREEPALSQPQAGLQHNHDDHARAVFPRPPMQCRRQARPRRPKSNDAVLPVTGDSHEEPEHSGSALSSEWA